MFIGGPAVATELEVVVDGRHLRGHADPGAAHRDQFISDRPGPGIAAKLRSLREAREAALRGLVNGRRGHVRNGAPPCGSDARTRGATHHAKSASDLLTGTAAFTPGEREYMRRGLDRFFSTWPSVADGFQLRTWRGGPQAGQPKVPPVAQGLLDRRLMRLQAAPWPPRLFFTEAGLVALRAMMADRRLANPVAFAHVRRELGIDPGPEEP